MNEHHCRSRARKGDTTTRCFSFVICVCIYIYDGTFYIDTEIHITVLPRHESYPGAN